MIITVARVPFIGGVCENIKTHQCGGINIAETRLETQAKSFLDGGRPPSGNVYVWSQPTQKRDALFYDGSKGRFPSNVFITEESGAILDQQSGVSVSTGGRIGNAEGVYAKLGASGFGTGHTKGDGGYGDIGGASRFYKVIQ